MADEDTPPDNDQEKDQDQAASSEEASKPAAPEQPQDNPLLNILFNVVIPIAILSYLSKDPSEEDAKFYHIGALWALILALILPIGYGLAFAFKHKKANFFSIVGLVSVLFTGGLTLYLWQEDGSVLPSAPVLFGLKEASIPLMLGIAIMVSHWTKTPLLKTFLYSPTIFDINRIEKQVKERNAEEAYDGLMLSSTIIFAASFLVSTLANYFLAQYFLGGIDFADAKNAREQYNQGVAKLTGWSFAVIGAPILLILFYVLWRLVNGLKRVTGLETDEILLPR